jgi:hypothetical protein
MFVLDWWLMVNEISLTVFPFSLDIFVSPDNVEELVTLAAEELPSDGAAYALMFLDKSTDVDILVASETKAVTL